MYARTAENFAARSFVIYAHNFSRQSTMGVILEFNQDFICTQVASIPTAQLFPDGFPSDFSILATFRAESQSKEMLFTIYNLEGKEVMSLKIGRRVKLYYQVKLANFIFHHEHFHELSKFLSQLFTRASRLANDKLSNLARVWPMTSGIDLESASREIQSLRSLTARNNRTEKLPGMIFPQFNLFTI